MQKWIWSLVLVFAGVVLHAQAPATYITYEQISVTGTPVGLTLSSVAQGNGHVQANYAYCTVETGSVRWSVDAHLPTASFGQLMQTTDPPLKLAGNLILQKIQWIATSVTATLNCTYADDPFWVP